MTLESLKSHMEKRSELQLLTQTYAQILIQKARDLNEKPNFQRKMKESIFVLKVNNSFLGKSQKATTKEKKLTHQTSLKETSIF